MSNSNSGAQLRHYFLEPGFIFVAKKPTLISSVLGSCVSVCVCDRNLKFGGMNHFRFPFIGDRSKATAYYGNVATLSLIRMMIENGSEKDDLEAHIFGGAVNGKVSEIDIGNENVRMARKALNRDMVRIMSEDVGGMIGRKIVLNTGSAELAVIRVEKLRRVDWYPYESDR